jgi:hypothetical protein
MDRIWDRIWNRARDRVRDVDRQNGDDLFHSVAIVLTVLGTLAFLSFVMASVVGAIETSQPPVESAILTAAPSN